MTEIRNNAGLIWSVAELLRGDYKQADYGKVILPMVVMRRLDQALSETKSDVVARAQELEAGGISNVEDVLRITSGLQFFNRSALSFPQLLEDPGNVANNLRAYIDGYSKLAHEVFENFEFEQQIDRLEKSNLLYMVIGRICDVDLHPDRVSNLEMGYLFEDLIRRFSEQSNETAGEHFTPREVVKLMGNLLLDGDEDALTQKGVIRTVFDCACGTGGMLSEVDEHIRELNPNANVHLFGQELNPESYAICLADMLVKGQDATNIVLGNSLSNDGHDGDKFHYCIANPPYGVDWSKVEDEIRQEFDEEGFSGRFGPGLPSKNDGQLLFTLHLLSKMREVESGGSRVAIVHNGSPLFSGGAASGPSEIRRWIIENDLLESIVALPEQLFYNTGIGTYVWLLTNRKSEERRGLVQLIDAREMYEKMPRSLGSKRREISPAQIDEITQLHGAFAESEHVKILANQDLGYRQVAVDRPLRARWSLSTGVWQGVESNRNLSKLDTQLQIDALAALRGLEAKEYAGEEECVTELRQVLIGAGVERPSVALVKSLALRCMTRDPSAPVIVGNDGEPLADPDLRDSELIPLSDAVSEYLDREVEPFAPGAWVAEPEGRVGYEIPFTKLFFKMRTPRSPDVVRKELLELEAEISRLFAEAVE